MASGLSIEEQRQHRDIVFNQGGGANTVSPETSTRDEDDDDPNDAPQTLPSVVIDPYDQSDDSDGW